MRDKIRILLLSLIWSACAPSKTFQDQRDGQVYKAVKVGSTWWMAQNLNFEPTTPGAHACYGDSLSSCRRYGRLYTWNVAMNLPSDCQSKLCLNGDTILRQGICPQGWFVPRQKDWDDLARAAGRGAEVGAVLKSARSGFGTWDYKDYHRSSSIRFEALPGGHRHPQGNFEALGYLANWWSGSEDCAHGAFRRYLEAGPSDLQSADFDKDFAFSLRCIQRAP